MPIIPDSITSDQVPSPVAGAAPTPPPPTQNLPVDSRQPQPSPVQPNPPVDRHQLLGRVVAHIKNAVEGHETVYTPDPNTGTVVESTQPRKPGGIFRDLLAGMMSGMAAASLNTEHPSGAAGLGLGFMNARADAQAQQDRARAMAQQTATAQFQRKQGSDKADLAAATVANDTMSTLHIGHFIPHFSDEEVSDYNGSVNAVRQILMQNGGQLADVQGNGTKGNGPAVAKAFNADPSIMNAANGFHRVASVVYDTDGLKHQGHQWTNEDGSQLSDDEWNKRATVYLTDVPNAVWNRSVALPGKTIQDVAPGSQLIKDPNRNYSTSIGSIFALGLRNKQDMITARNELYKAPQNEQEALALKAEADQINGDPNAPADLKRRAGIKGPMAETFLQGLADQKQAMTDAGPEKPEKLTGEELAYKEYLDTKPSKPMSRLQFHRQWDEKPKPDKPEKPADMVIGSIGGKQVAVPFDEASNYKWDAGGRPTKAGAAESEKVNNARSLINVFDSSDADDPGLLQLAAKLDQEGKLGPATTRFQSWLNKGNTVANFNAGDPDVQRLFTKMGLSTTGLMQVHVGARGSAQMLEHFEDLAKAKEMSSSAFRTALDTESRYVRMKAMLPSAQRSASAPNQTSPAKSVSNPSLVQSLIQKHGGQ